MSRKSSGFWETMFKTIFREGTTVHREKDWLGRKRTIVKHHDSGKTKTYTHGTGFFGNTTKTVTKNRQGDALERGKIKKTFLLQRSVEKAKKVNSGEKVKRSYGRGLTGKKMVTKTPRGKGVAEPGFIAGTRSNYTSACNRCDGSGKRRVKCRTCSGTGNYVGICYKCEGAGLFRPATRKCSSCDGHGIHPGYACMSCSGAGFFEQPEHTCSKCKGSGKYTAPCKRCSSSGELTIACKHCGGTGVY